MLTYLFVEHLSLCLIKSKQPFKQYLLSIITIKKKVNK